MIFVYKSQIDTLKLVVTSQLAMKLALVLLLTTVGTLMVEGIPINNVSDSSTKLLSGLQEDFNEFLALVPTDKITEIILEYLASDEDFQATMEYIFSDDFKTLVVEVEVIPEVKTCLKYLQDSGIDVYSLMDTIHDFLGLDHFDPLKTNYALQITGGLPGLIADIKAILPLKELEALYKQKLETSTEFADFVKALESPEFQKTVDAVFTNQKVKDMISRAEAKGVDVKAILDIISKMFGIHFPTRHIRSVLTGLEQDFNDFLKLVPVKKVEEIVLEYLATDEDFQETAEYILSDEFKALLLEIEEIPDVKDFMQYLNNIGLDPYALLDTIHDFLGLEHFVPLDQSFDSIKITGGLPGLIEDIKAVIPLQEIQELYEEKLKTSKPFAALIKRLGSPEFQKIVDTVYANEKLQELIKRAEAKGVDVKAILQLITEILGIHFPSRYTFSITRGLADDLNEFVALVPSEKIEEIVMEYLATDEDFQGAVDYMLSDEFKDLIKDVEAIEDVKVFIKYLADSGLDVYTLLNKVHDFLGLEHITPSLRMSGILRITGGLPGLIEDVKAVLPLEKIEALYQEKLKSSEDFAALIKRLGSPEFQKIVDTVYANEKLQELIKRAEAKGVDVKAILKLITEILGIHFPSRYTLSITRGLADDLDEFVALVPSEKIEEIVMEYLATDEDFQGAVDYMLSDEFKDLIKDVEAIEDVKVFIKYLADSGLDVYTLLNKVHDFLGLEHITPSLRMSGILRITGGLPGLIEDVKAVLPLEKIEALYQEKLKSSEDFAALIKRLGSPEFQKIVDTVYANEKLQELIKRAEAKGVDVKAILKLITEILGIHFPSSMRLSVNLSYFATERNLKDDLNDLLALMPKDEIVELSVEYVASDEDFQAAVAYVISDDFGKFVLDIEAIEGVPEFLKYLHNSGLDVYNFLNKLHAIWDLAPITSPMGFEVIKITGGLPGFIHDIKALLPLDKIAALYQEKLQNSKPLQDLLQRIHTPEFQKMVDVLMTHEKLNDLMDKAEARGVDVNAILRAISNLLGITLPPRPEFLYRSVALTNQDLINDLKDIAALVPHKKIAVIVMRYATKDKDFKRIVKYFRTNEFHKLIREVETIPETKALLKYLTDIGLDVDKFIRIFHKLINMKNVQTRQFLEVYITGGISGFIEDIRAVLPLEKLYDLYDEKLANSPAFAEFVERLRSKELQNLINALAENNDIQKLLNTLESMGVDIDQIFKLLSDFFGIMFPERPHH